MRQSYEGPFAVTVINDGSADNTSRYRAPRFIARISEPQA
jgi:hypothetical protein